MFKLVSTAATERAGRQRSIVMCIAIITEYHYFFNCFWHLSSSKLQKALTDFILLVALHCTSVAFFPATAQTLIFPHSPHLIVIFILLVLAVHGGSLPARRGYHLSLLRKRHRLSIGKVLAVCLSIFCQGCVVGRCSDLSLLI